MGDGGGSRSAGSRHGQRDGDREKILEGAAWYQGGKHDPKLRLLRFDPDWAQVWLNENSVFSALKLMLGRDPKQEYQDKVADVKLAG